jgi:hypothetical protein
VSYGGAGAGLEGRQRDAGARHAPRDAAQRTCTFGQVAGHYSAQARRTAHHAAAKGRPYAGHELHLFLRGQAIKVLTQS